MIRLRLAATGGAAALLALAATAIAADRPYAPPRLSFGQPDLGENWSNVSMTPESRPPSLGTRAVYTTQEAQAIERASAKALQAANQKTDPNAPPPTAEGRLGVVGRAGQPE